MRLEDKFISKREIRHRIGKDEIEKKKHKPYSQLNLLVVIVGPTIARDAPSSRRSMVVSCFINCLALLSHLLEMFEYSLAISEW